jgi:hypothetical protein
MRSESLAVALLLLFTSPQARPQPTDESLETRSGAKSLEAWASSDSPHRGSQMRKLLEQRREFIGKLMEIVDGSSSNAVRRDAAFLLGAFRAVEAIPVLIKNLDLDDSGSNVRFSHDKELGDRNSLPVSSALQKIGAPAVSALMSKILEVDDAKTVGKCVVICKSIEGREVSKFRLQSMLDREIDPKRKERLGSALRILNDLKDD